MFKELVTPSTAEFTLLSNIKIMGEYRTSQQDDELKAIQERAESFTARYISQPILNETWNLYFDRNEVSNKTLLQGMNISSITSYNVTDQNATETAVTASKYRLSNGNVIFDATSSQGPLDGTNARYLDAVRIEVISGFGATRDDLPIDLRDGIASLIIHWQQNNISSFDDAFKWLPKTFTDAMIPFSNVQSWVG